MIQAENLRKSYGDLAAVDGVSFRVDPGEIYGLLGPNGAGKTTTLSMLCGLLAPDAGQVRIGGLDLRREPARVKRMIGVVPQETAIYEELSARENLNFWGGLHGLSGSELRRRVGEILERVGLTDRAGEPARRYSGGMKRRLNLAAGLVHAPRVLLLDEPTVGIDPQARINILDVVRETATAGTAVLYTTHYLEEAEQLCRRTGILDHGRILAEGTLEELQRIVGQGVLVTLRGTFTPEELTRGTDSLEGVRVVHFLEGEAVLACDGAESALPEMLGGILSRGWKLESVSLKKPSLQDVFLKLTGRELRD
jgi:ABC-2 type transport system ATP-binding protein